MEVSYSELHDIFIEKVSQIDNLKQFCTDNQLEKSYNLIVNIKNRTANKKYSALIKTVLNILGYEVEKIRSFDLQRKSNLSQ